MPISVSCACGKILSVKDELAGKRGKCPACGAMLVIPQPVKPVSKPVEEEWSLAPLDDDPKPVKTAPKPVAGNTAKPPAAVPAKSASTPPTPMKTASAQPAAFADAEFSLAPLDDDLFGKPSAAKPAAAKPPAPAASTAAAASAAPAKKIPLGGQAPAPLDLPPLDDDFFPNPVAAASKQVRSAKPLVSAAKTTSAASATKSLGGAAPAPLDLAPLAGGEEQNHAAWIDIGSESHFTVIGAPLSSDTGQIFAGPCAPAPVDVPPGGLPGQLLCPFCNKDLDIVTASDVMPQLALGALTGIHLAVAPFNCRNCGPIEHKQLIGESIKTVKKKAAEKERAIFKVILIILLIITVLVSVPMYIMPWWNSWRQAVRHQEALEKGEQMRLEMEERRKASQERFEKEDRERQQRFNMPPMGMPGNFPTGPMPEPQTPRPAQPIPQPRPKSKQEAEEMHKKNEERRRQFEERVKKMQEQSKQPAAPRPNPAPSKPVTPTPMPPVSPFEETTLPPTAPPKTMPVNPFQPID